MGLRQRRARPDRARSWWRNVSLWAGVLALLAVGVVASNGPSALAAAVGAPRAPELATQGAGAGSANLLATPNGTVWALNNAYPQGQSVLRSTDNGLNWARTLTVTLPSTDCCGLAASYFLGPDDAWAVDEVLHGDGVGETTTVYGTVDGGRHWWRTKGLPGDVTTFVGAPLFDQLYFANPQDGWLLGVGEDLSVGTGETLVLRWWRTTDGGRQWSALPNTNLPMQAKAVSEFTPCPSSSPPRLTFTSPTVGWLTEGDCASGPARPLVWRTTDGGGRWTPVALATPPGGWGKWYVDEGTGTDMGAVSVTASPGGTVLLVPLTTGASRLVVERSTNLGATWAVASDVALPALAEDGSPSNWFDPLNADQWVEALPSAVMGTSDAGRHWQLVRSFQSLAYSGSPVVSFTSLRRGFALGNNDLIVAASTDDYGHTWQAEPVPSSLYDQLASDQLDNGLGPPISTVQQVGGDLAVAAGSSGLEVSADGGRTWAERLGPATPVTQVDVVSADLTFVLAGGQILRTGDNGLHWFALLQPAAGAVAAVNFWSARSGVALVTGPDNAFGVAYFATSDAGAHWSALPLPSGWHFSTGMADDSAPGSVCFSANGTGWAAGTRVVASKAPGHHAVKVDESQLFVSTDGGKSWQVALASSALPKPNWSAGGQGSGSSGAGLQVGACRGETAWAISYQPGGLGNMQGVPMTFDLLETTDLGRSWSDVLRSPAYQKVSRPQVPAPPGGPTAAVAGFGTLVPQSLSGAPGTQLSSIWVTASNPNLGGETYAVTDDAGLKWAQQYFSAQAKAPASALPQEGWASTSALSGQAAWALFNNTAVKGRRDKSLLYATTDSGAQWYPLHTFTWPGSLLLPPGTN